MEDLNTVHLHTLLMFPFKTVLTEALGSKASGNLVEEATGASLDAQ